MGNDNQTNFADDNIMTAINNSQHRPALMMILEASQGTKKIQSCSLPLLG